jgi:very-short-patch-repair endonuclease
VVKFIIRAVDDVLKTHFWLAKWLADTSKIEQKVYLQKDAKWWARKQATEMVHRVQILDPATGTGTFLNEIIHYIHAKMAGQAGMWPSYVENDLLPRLHGFELMMASYTIAHLKIGLTLAETGVTHLDRRLQIYLTNSLEEAKSKKEDQGTLFWLLESITDEARQADEVKRDKPVMIVVGNPPYSVSSTNKGEWIQNLLTDYKKWLGEKKINLDDDYIKFIRFGESLIEKNGEWVLAYISNNSFIDGITHRQMRNHLMETFDSIYILDLHGSAKKKETALDGSKDENVFDIMQWVSINIFIKNSPLEGSPKAGVAKKLAQVHHLDLYGKRNDKYDWLENHSLEDFQQLNPVEPYYFFVPKDFSENVEYEKGFKVDELFPVWNSGIKTDRDELFIDENKDILIDRMHKLLWWDMDSWFVERYNVKDSGSYKITQKISWSIFDSNFIRKIEYRPFDERWIYYDKTIISRPADKVMRHLIHENLSLSLKRQAKFHFSYAFIHKNICESCLFESAYANNSEFPLYLYPDSNGTTPPSGHPSNGGESWTRWVELSGGDISQWGEFSNRVANLDPMIAEKIAQSIGMKYAPTETSLKTNFANFPPVSVGGISARNSPPLEGCPKGGVVASESSTTDILTPEAILDYIYAVLHSPSYREKYKEFLKIDFPRVPYPQDRESFDALVKLGGELRVLHLLESPKVEEYITTFPVAGTNEVGKILPRSTDNSSHSREVLSENSPSAEGVAFDVGEWQGRFPLRKLWDLPYNPLLKERARELRTQGILSEVLFWNMVKNKQILWLDFDRQRIIGNYIVDFYLSSLGMVFEIDGSSHDDKVEYDANRDEFLQSLGLQVIHILDHDVKKNIEWVMHIVRESIEKRRLEFEETTQPSGQPPHPVGHPSMGGEFSEQTQYGASWDDFLDIYINDIQYFGSVPRVAWEFYIGWYQPAQKWLKDRKGRTLTWEDIAHYQSMIVALTETARVMGEVDKVLEV